MTSTRALFVCGFALFLLSLNTGCSDLEPLSPVNIANNETGKQKDLENRGDDLVNELSIKYAMNLDTYTDISKSTSWLTDLSERDDARSKLNELVDVCGQIIGKIDDHKVFAESGERDKWQTRLDNANKYLTGLNNIPDPSLKK